MTEQAVRVLREIAQTSHGHNFEFAEHPVGGEAIKTWLAFAAAQHSTRAWPVTRCCWARLALLNSISSRLTNARSRLACNCDKHWAVLPTCVR